MSERVEVLVGLGGSTLIRVSDGDGNGVRFLAVRTAAGLDALRRAIAAGPPAAQLQEIIDRRSAKIVELTARLDALEAELVAERRRTDELAAALAAGEGEARR